MMTRPSSIRIGAAATLACVYEATARKPGNVHPGADFDDTTTYAAFIHSAVLTGPILGRARDTGVGQTVLDAVRETRAAVGTNTNLGTLLLLAPLAAVPSEQTLADGIGGVLNQLTATDTWSIYEAIVLSGAGGLGRSDEADVFYDVPTLLSLVDAMRLASDRDLVARQYANRFADVFQIAASMDEDSSCNTFNDVIVSAYLRQLAIQPDSLIQRKCGPQIANEATSRAAAVLKRGLPDDPSYQEALADFDRWLRADGHRRNPGTTADLIAAGLFVLLREGRLDWNVW
jgi:triphosphoribosyl-dephospho-CoA synthase